jgi:hypothetical protein
MRVRLKVVMTTRMVMAGFWGAQALKPVDVPRAACIVKARRRIQKTITLV